MRQFSRAVGATLVVVVLVTGCGKETVGAPAPAPDPAADLAPLIAAPAGFAIASTATGEQDAGPFDPASYLTDHSAAPLEDKTLFGAAKLIDGYHSVLTEAPKPRRIQIFLYRLQTEAGAQQLYRELWQREQRGPSFPVAGIASATSESRVTKTYRPDRTTAIASVSFVVGRILATVTVKHSVPKNTRLAPDTNLAAAIAKQQSDRLTGSAVALANPAADSPPRSG